MPKPGPRTTTRYSDEFKATAVRLSELPGVRVQDVQDTIATALGGQTVTTTVE